jgi:hypothetical protein
MNRPLSIPRSCKNIYLLNLIFSRVIINRDGQDEKPSRVSATPCQKGLSLSDTKKTCAMSEQIGYITTRCLTTRFRQLTAYGLSVGIGPTRHSNAPGAGRIYASRVAGKIV